MHRMRIVVSFNASDAHRCVALVSELRHVKRVFTDQRPTMHKEHAHTHTNAHTHKGLEDVINDRT